MPEEHEGFLLKSAAVLSCKYIVVKICEGLSIGLAAQKRLLEEESGPFVEEPDSLAKAMDQLIDQIGKLVFGKARIHSVLYGDEEDKRIVATIHAILQQCRTDIATPLRSISATSPEESAVFRKVRDLSKLAASLHDQVQLLLSEAKVRFAAANLAHFRNFSTEWLNQELPVEEEWTVVSVDKVAYSIGALAIESLGNAKALLDHNRAILTEFMMAIRIAGGDVNETLVHASGDGALLYFRDPNLAVQASLEVHKLAREDSLRIPDLRWAKKFRVGIATGPVCVCRRRAWDGRTIQHEAGGITIINAVRLEGFCEPQELWACNRTVHRLKRDLQDQFSDPQNVASKGHEERSISACKFRF